MDQSTGARKCVRVCLRACMRAALVKVDVLGSFKLLKKHL